MQVLDSITPQSIKSKTRLKFFMVSFPFCVMEAFLSFILHETTPRVNSQTDILQKSAILPKMPPFFWNSKKS
jgi:hypothetical protein